MLFDELLSQKNVFFCGRLILLKFNKPKDLQKSLNIFSNFNKNKLI